LEEVSTHAVAGGSAIRIQNHWQQWHADHRPTRYRVVVLTSSKHDH